MEWLAQKQVNYHNLDTVLKNSSAEVVAGITHTAKLFDMIASKHLEAYDLSLSQFEVLCEVFFSAKRINLSDISKVLRVSKPTISGLVGRLKKKNFIVLVDSEEDSRVSYMQLTNSGEEVVKQTILHYADFANQLFPDVTAQEKEIVVKVISGLYKRLLESSMMEEN